MEYIENCQRLNRELEEANVVYNATEHMRHGNSHTIESAITLHIEIPSQKILESATAVGKRVRVSCAVEAELRASKIEATTQTYRIKAAVSTPLDQRIAEGLERVASLLTSAQGLVVALTALAGAIIALRFAVTRKQAKSLPHDSGPPP